MRISLRIKMLVLSFIIVSVSIITSGWMVVNSSVNAFEEEVSQRAIAIARTVAQMTEISNNVGEPGGEKAIQLIAEKTRKATNVDYIVIIDMNRIRYSHPSPNLIGKKFVGGDENNALSNSEYVSKAQGTLGNSVRAFVPILEEDGQEQVGVAVVGILTPTFQSLIANYSNDLILSLIWGLIIGLFGSFLLAHNIKKQTFGLEPYEIAKLAEERSAVMQAMDMGIIASDEQGNITFINRLAKLYIQQEETDHSLHLKDVFPHSWITIVNQLKTEHTEPMINRPVVLYSKTYLLSLYHIRVKGKLVGTLLTMFDRTEATQLAEELTGVKALVDALRAQSHEYMNKLHSIAGLIQLERTEEALEVILNETEEEENSVQFLKERFEDYSVSGLLLGKRSRASELGILFSIDHESYLKKLEILSSSDIVTIVGNLIENAFESFENDKEYRFVTCLLQGDAHHLLISVTDNGKGIVPQVKKDMFKYGYSTKNKEGHGIGLALVNQIVSAQKGIIEVKSEFGQGTEISIKINRGIRL